MYFFITKAFGSTPTPTLPLTEALPVTLAKVDEV